MLAQNQIYIEELLQMWPSRIPRAFLLSPPAEQESDSPKTRLLVRESKLVRIHFAWLLYHDIL